MIKSASILIASALLAAPAFAEGETFAFKFSFDRAALATADGVERVHRDLQIAVAAACRLEAPSAQRGVDPGCRTSLTQQALERIGDQRLAAISSKAARVAGR